MLGNSGLARQLQASALGSPLESEAADDPTPGEGTKERPDFDPTRSELAPAFKLTRIARVPPALVESMLGGFSNDNTRPSGEGEVAKYHQHYGHVLPSGGGSLHDAACSSILSGFKDTAKEAGTKISGGQTVRNPWLMIGGVATSICKSIYCNTRKSSLIFSVQNEEGKSQN